MTVEVRHLRMIRAIREAGTVTEAAHRLGLTQPAVSHALAGLEEKLGAELFLRDRSGTTPTPEGERLLEAADRMLEELARAEHDIGELASGRQGLLRITTECYTCYHWIPTVLARFREKFPGVAVRIVPEATRQPFASLRKGAVDLAIVHSLPKSDDVRTVDLFADEQVVLVAPDHPWARRSHVEPDAFSGETLVIHFGFEESFLLERVLQPAGVRPDHVLEVQLTEAVLATVKAGIGVTVMARWAVAPSLERGEFAALSLTAEGVRRPWYAATLASRSDRPAVAAFLQSLGDDALRAAERAPRAGEG